MNDRITLTNFSESVWHAEQLDHGVLYYNGDPSPQTVDAVNLLRGLITGDTPLSSLKKLSSEGYTADTYTVGDELVVKAFTKAMHPGKQQNGLHPRNSGLPYLQASVALHEGLEHTYRDKIYAEAGTTFNFEAPKMYGLFRPHNLNQHMPISVMARGKGEGRETSHDIPAPSHRLVTIAYQDALKAAGLPVGRVHIDATGDNRLLRVVSPNAVRVTQLDILGAGYKPWPVGNNLNVRQKLGRASSLVGRLLFETK